MSLTFTFHAPRERKTIGVDVHNALVTDAEDRVLILGSELGIEDAQALTAAFATDGGTVVFHDTDATVASMRSHCDYIGKKTKCPVRFGTVKANTADAPIVAYVVALKKSR